MLARVVCCSDLLYFGHCYEVQSVRFSLSLIVLFVLVLVVLVLWYVRLIQFSSVFSSVQFS